MSNAEFISDIPNDSLVDSNLQKDGQEVVETFSRSSKKESPLHAKSSKQEGGSRIVAKCQRFEVFRREFGVLIKGEVEASTLDLQNVRQIYRFYWRFIREAAVSVFDVHGNWWREEPRRQRRQGDYGLVISPGHIHPDGWVFRFPRTNTTILCYWSASLCDLEPVNPSDPSIDVAMHLDCPPAFMRRFLRNFDVLVLNTGHHWNRGKLNAIKWAMCADGKPNKDKNPAAMGNARNFTVHTIVRWLDSQLPAHPRLKAFF